MNRRGVRLASLFEWLAAAGAVVAVAWLIAVPVERATGPRAHAAVPHLAPSAPAGVPATALAVPVMFLLDGREIRQGHLLSDVTALLHEREATGPAETTPGVFGDRHFRTYVAGGVRFIVVSERQEPGGPMRVAGIYLP